MSESNDSPAYDGQPVVKDQRDPSILDTSDPPEARHAIASSTDGEQASISSAKDLFASYKCFDKQQRVWTTDAPKTAGPFTLEKEIGRGGMGRVWVARQDEPIKRTVAIKLIKPSPHSKLLVRRFESERIVLAMMNHPGIATIIDAGETEDGRLYFAMEFVNGPDLIHYCNDHRLNTENRLRLFLDACAAVQHAHQKGIIHRDLKPTNILVGQIDNQARLKVIDFGLSKAEFGSAHLDPDLNAITTHPSHHGETLDGQVLGSVRYMSPEQAAGEVGAIDIRSDIYSLGIVLYKLLTDSIPLDKESLRDKPIDSVLAAIQHEPDITPSRWLAESSDSTRDKVLRLHQSEAGKYKKILQEDLDWIVMKAIEKNPDDRYSSVSDFAADINRFLNHEAVRARPKSRWYVAKKELFRNRALWASVAGVAIALLIGGLLSVVGLVRATKAEKLAEKRLERSRQSNEILADIFTDLNVHSTEFETEPFKIAVGRKLVAAAERLNDDSIGDPLEVAKLQLKLATALISIDFFDEAIPISRDAYNIAKEHDDAGNLGFETGKTLVIALNGAAETDEAIEILTPLIDECFAAEGKDNETYLELLLLDGKIASTNFEPKKARESFEKVVLGRELLFGKDDSRTIDAKYWLSKYYTERGVADAGLSIMKDVAESSRKVFPKGHPRTIQAILTYAWALSDSGEFSKGLQFAEEGFELAKQTFGNDHPVTYDGMLTVGLLVHRAGDFERGAPMLEKAWAGLSESAGLDHPRAITARIMLAQMSQRVGDLKRATELLEQSLALSRKQRGVELKLARLYLEAGEHEKALTLLQDTLDGSQNEGEDGQRSKPDQLRLSLGIAECHAAQGNHDNAIAILRESRSELGANDLYDFQGMRVELSLARYLNEQGDHEQAVAVIDKYLDGMPDSMGPKHRLRLASLAEKGLVLRRSGKHDQAITQLNTVVKSGVMLRHNELLIKEWRLALAAAGRDEEVMETVERERNHIERRFPVASIQQATQLRRLGYDLIDCGYHQKAKELLLESVVVLSGISNDSWMLEMTKFDIARLTLDLQTEDSTDADVSIELEASWNQLVRMSDEVFPIDRTKLTNSVEDVARVFEEMEDERSAETWRQRLKLLAAQQ